MQGQLIVPKTNFSIQNLSCFISLRSLGISKYNLKPLKASKSQNCTIGGRILSTITTSNKERKSNTFRTNVIY